MDTFLFAGSMVLAQDDATGRRINLIVLGLVAVAALLAFLTAWYWRATDPQNRQERASGRGGRRPPGREPEPDPSPGPKGGRVSDAPPPVIPDAGSDQTRVLSRAQILEPKTVPGTLSEGAQPQIVVPDVIDLRSDPEAVPISEPAAESAPIVDLTEHQIDLSDDAVEAEAAGAHDSGLDFNDWLALAEEDK